MLKKFLPERLARLRVPPFLVAFLCGILPVPVYSSLPDQLLYKPLYGLPILFLALFHRQLIHARNGKEAALLGFSHGLGLFLGGVSWVYVSLADFAAMPVPVAALLTFCFCCYLALYPLLAASIFHVLRRFSPQDLQPWLFAGCFTLAEFLRGTLLTGFPWLSLGYSQTPGTSPLAGLAPLLGVYGVSFLAYLSAAWIACLCFPFRRARLGPSAYTWLFLLQLGIFLTSLHWEWTRPSGEPVSVALLQGNVEQSLKWQPQHILDTLLLYQEMVAQNPAQLIILPETALPIFQDNLPPDYQEGLRRHLAEQGSDLLFGIPTREGEAYQNSAVGLGVSPEQRYAKRHLVPFGEFIPPGFHWFLRLAEIPLSDFTPGVGEQAPLRLAGQTVAVNICYEDIFGRELLAGLENATLLVNLSNTAWFGRSFAPGQHLNMARMRALETGRPMLRVGNTGITALVTPQGTVAAELPPFTRAALHVETRGYSGLTPYARHGDWPAFLIALLAILLPLKNSRKNSAPAA